MSSATALPPLECHAQQASHLLSLLEILVEEGMPLPEVLPVTINGDDDTALALINRIGAQLGRRGCDISCTTTPLVHRLTVTHGSASYAVIHPRRPGNRMETA